MHTLQGIFESDIFKNLYNENTRSAQIKRYSAMQDKYEELYGKNEYHIYSAPGRTEIGGNHTDHNNGKVIAAAVNRDAVCFAAATVDNCITLYDLQYKEHIQVDLLSLERIPIERQTIQALIRGIAAELKIKNYQIGGFCGCLHSEVFSGSGLSSSAALEILVIQVFNDLYNTNSIDFIEAAKIGQAAENKYFDKPCGLMDQTVSSAGGMVFLDFKNPDKPLVEKLGNPLQDSNYCLAVVSPGGDHCGLTEYYSAIPAEMKAVAGFFGKEVCRDVTIEQLFENAVEIRRQTGDRSFLRAYHYLNENIIVDKQLASLKKNDIQTFLNLINKSGNSSWKYLQNIYVAETPGQQDLAVALAVADCFVSRNEGACRVHGGGFAGTIQTFIRTRDKQAFEQLITGIFGPASLSILEIREKGSCTIGSVSY